MWHIILKVKERSLLVVLFSLYTHKLINIQSKTFCFENYAQKYALYLCFLFQTLRWGVFHSRSIHFFAFAFVMTVRLLFTFSFQYFFWATRAMNCTVSVFCCCCYCCCSLICVWTLSSSATDRNCEFIVPIRKMEMGEGRRGGGGKEKCKHSKFITTTRATTTIKRSHCWILC